jgi:hypothetical protein
VAGARGGAGEAEEMLDRQLRLAREPRQQVTGGADLAGWRGRSDTEAVPPYTDPVDWPQVVAGRGAG